MKKFQLFSLAALAAVIGLYSCSKNGSTGATGPKGPAGPDSVKSSAWINANFIGYPEDGDSIYQMEIQDNSVTQGILDSGLIISYVGFHAGSADFTDVEPASELGFGEDYTPGAIYYTTFPTDEGGLGNSLNPGNLNPGAIRYVLIPGNVISTNSAFKGMSKAQISTMSYSKITSVPGVSIQNN